MNITFQQQSIRRQTQLNINKLYDAMKKEHPMFVHVNTIRKADILISCLTNGPNMSEEIQDYVDQSINNSLYTELEIDYDKIQNELEQIGVEVKKVKTVGVPNKKDDWVSEMKQISNNSFLSEDDKQNLENLNVWGELEKSCLCYFPFPLLCIIVDNPEMEPTFGLMNENFMKFVNENKQN